jgi:iron complex outermembrane recepter protein
VLNASLGWTSADERLALQIWGRNLTDEDYIANQGVGSPSTPTGSYWAPPRTYGASVTFSF